MRHAVFCLASLALFAACSSPEASAPSAQQLVDDAISAHGGAAYNPARITFNFRGDVYTVELDGGRYAYMRTFEDSTGTLQDVLDNDGLRRTRGGRAVALDSSEHARATITINSVPYFALLPYRLNDPAVVKTYAGADTIAGEPYERVAVSFQAEGGGPDFDDHYLYWFHRDRHTMDYLAYTYSDDGTQYRSRFRVAKNPRTAGGIRFADFVNFAAPHAVLENDLLRYSALYNSGTLDTISTIALTDEQVGR